MNPATSDSPHPPPRPTSEAWAMRGEWRDQPPSLAIEEAGRALDALGRAAGETTGAAPGDTLPPVPDDLRARWAEAYGRPASEEPAVRAPRPQAENNPGHRFAEWLSALVQPRRAAWFGGAGVALAAIAMMLSEGGGGGVISGDSMSGATRGSTPSVTGPVCPVAVIVPASALVAKDEVLSVLRQAYPDRELKILASANEAAAMAQAEPRLVVVNLGSGLVTAWRGGELAGEFPATSGAPASSVVGQVERADDALPQPATAP